jgi:hypothetical protein
MSADPDGYAGRQNVIRLGGETAVVVPLVEYRMMKALADRAAEQEREDAWAQAAIAENEEWEAAGRPGGTIPHKIVMAEFEAAWRSRGGSDS